MATPRSPTSAWPGTQRHDVAQMSFAGTPAYMAPEVWGGEGGPASDLYGFAMSYIELRQGSTPFKFGKVMEVMQAHLNGNFDFADFIGEAERTVLRRALAKEPADRYPSCLAFVEDLAERLAGRSTANREQFRRHDRALAAARPGGNHPYVTVRTTGPLPIAEEAETLQEAGRWDYGGAHRRGEHRHVRRQGTRQPRRQPAPRWRAPVANGNDGVLPDGATAKEGSKIVALADGRRLPQWLTVAHNGETVRFRLIARCVRPSNISQSKVWNKLYGSPGDPEAPAVRMTANEAAAFAASLGEAIADTRGMGSRRGLV